jgi:hypothetical protein
LVKRHLGIVVRAQADAILVRLPAAILASMFIDSSVALVLQGGCYTGKSGAPSPTDWASASWPLYDRRLVGGNVLNYNPSVTFLSLNRTLCGDAHHTVHHRAATFAAQLKPLYFAAPGIPIDEMKDEGPVEDSMRLGLSIRFQPTSAQAAAQIKP